MSRRPSIERASDWPPEADLSPGETWACDPIPDLDWGGPGLAITDPGSFHPNAQGHAAMAALLAEQLRNPRYP